MQRQNQLCTNKLLPTFEAEKACSKNNIKIKEEEVEACDVAVNFLRILQRKLPLNCFLFLQLRY